MPSYTIITEAFHPGEGTLPRIILATLLFSLTIGGWLALGTEDISADEDLVVPYIHQKNSPPDIPYEWNGQNACGAAAAAMLVAYHGRVTPDPTYGYGYHVNQEYTNGYGYTFNTPTNESDPPYNSFRGSFGYVYHGPEILRIRVVDYLQKHGLISWVDVDPTEAKVKAEIDAGYPVYASTSLSGLGHEVLIKGYTASNYKVHDPLWGQDNTYTWSQMGVSTRYIIIARSAPPPTVVSCDSGGNPRDVFALGEGVYVTASGLASNKTYRIWIQGNPVDEADTIVPGEDPSGTSEEVNSDGSGVIIGQPILIWSIPAEGSPTAEEWDIIIDQQDDGDDTGQYDSLSDGIDSASTAGMIAPVPELPTIVMIAVGLISLAGYRWVSKRRAAHHTV